MDEPRWRAAPGTLRVAPLDLFTAIYHRPSGQTHLLVEPAPQILEALAKPATEAELALRLADLFDGVEDREALAARVRELADVGLIAPA